MKFKPNHRYTTIAIYAFLVVAAALLFSQAIQNFSVLTGYIRAMIQFIQPVVFGFIFAFLLNPMLRMYDDRLLVFLFKKKLRPTARRGIALLLTYLSVIIILGLFFRLVVPQLLISIKGLIDMVPEYMRLFDRLYNELLSWMRQFQIFSESSELNLLRKTLYERLNGSLANAFENAYEWVGTLMPQLFSAGARITSGVINFLLGLIISIYFLFDREKLFAQTRKISNALFSDRTTNLFHGIAIDANRVFSGFIIGKIIDSAIIGVICYIGLYFMNMPFTMLISVIVGVTNVIPYFGPFIGAIPSTLILLIANPVKALWFVIFILVLQQFDGNILGPKILGDTTGLSALWVIFAIMLFSGLFGVVGMFIGVPLFAMIYTLVKRLVTFLLIRKGRSINTRDYDSNKNPLIK